MSNTSAYRTSNSSSYLKHKRGEYSENDERDSDFSTSSSDEYGKIDSEDSDEEPEFEETEEDRRFIADDSEEEEEEEENYLRNNKKDDDDDGDDDDDEEHDNDHGHSLKKIRPSSSTTDQASHPHRHHTIQSKKKKKRKKRLEDVELDDEDLELVEENTGLKIKPSKTFKRLKKGRKRDTPSTSHRPPPSYQSLLHKDLTSLFDDDAISAGMHDHDNDDDLDENDDFIVDDIDSGEEMDGLDLHSKSRDTLGQRDWLQNEPSDFQQRHRQRVFGKPPSGISEEALDDIHQIFGDGAEYDWALQLQLETDSRPRPLATRHDEDLREGGDEEDEDEVKLTDVFEPSEVYEKMLTAEDEEIRVTDLPERFQLTSKRPLEPTELLEASQWCAMAILKARGQASAYMDPDDPLVLTLTQLLKFLHEDKLEIPFLLRHRKEYWSPMLEQDEVWQILDEVERFRTFYQKRTSLFTKRRQLNIQDPTFMDSIYSVNDLDAIHDLHAYLSFHFGRALAEASKKTNLSGLRPLMTMDSYKEFRNDKVKDFLSSFLLSEVNFMDNYRNSSTLHTPPTPSISLSSALQPLFPSWIDPSKFLDSLSRYVATTLFHHPELRKVYREMFMEKSELSIVPTEQGKSSISTAHPYFKFKYIKSKPIKEIANDAFLEYHEAEKLGWVELRFTLEDQPAFFQSLVNAYATREGHEWNTLRISIFKDADAMLTKHAEQMVKEKLFKQAIQSVAKACGSKLFDLGYVAPYTTEPDSTSMSSGWGQPSVTERPSQAPKKEARVLALGLLTAGRQAAVFGAVIHKRGRMEDFFSRSTVSHDWPIVLNQYSPEVIVVGVYSHPMLKSFIDTIQEAASAANIPVQLLADTVPKLYASGQWAKKEFPDFKPEIRYCIGLGRFLQDPVFVLASLFPKDILQLALHPKQSLIPEELLLHHLETAMIRIITEIGVDMNLAYTCPPTSHVLQFVCGLGPRKASGLLQKMIQIGTLPGRDALVTNQCMGKIVFLNCSSFLRFSRLPGGYDVFDPLDSTRIHPEDYSLARKMAKDALDIDDIDEDEDVFLSKYVEELMEGGRIDALEDLSLDDYALEIEKQVETKKRFTLDMIKSELKSPYKDDRPSFQGIQKDDLFQLLIEDQLKKGTVVEVVITKLAEKYARCRIHRWIDGILWRRNVCEDSKGTIATSLQVGQKKMAVVMELNAERFSVVLSLLKKDIDASLSSPPPSDSLDPHFDNEKYEAEVQESQLKANYPVSGPPALPLTAKHPLFRPFNAQQAHEYLKSKDIGEAIIRPSSEGSEHQFMISWVVVKNLLQHVPVIQDPTTKKYSLRINAPQQEDYHDFDEILFKYVEACAKQVAQVVGFRKFTQGSRQDLERILKREIKAYPGAAAYGICPNEEFPGYFSIIYMSQHGELHELGFKVVPKGFSFQGRVYTNIEQVMNAFKNGFNSVS